MSALLEQLTRRQLLWHGNSQQAAYQAVASGYAELDKQLGGGFPATGLIDIQTEQGIGELRLLLPYLQQQQHSTKRLIVLISPPAQPCADMFAGAGIDLAQLLIISAKAAKDVLWAAEQCLNSGSVAAIVLWQVPVRLAQARRLQLAAEQGQASLVLMRRPSALSLPVQLSLQLTPHPQGLLLRVHKRKGGWPGAGFLVDMHSRWPALSANLPHDGPQQRKAG
jgi:protein ImuA